MIIWGGELSGGGKSNTGGRYVPAVDAWTATSLSNAPTERERHTAVWTGNEMIVWGGDDNNGDANTGGRYAPCPGRLDTDQHYKRARPAEMAHGSLDWN